MSLLLHELLMCCRGLESDKATERKKEADKFKRLIVSPETVEALDRASSSRAAKGSKQLTWDAVFGVLRRYVERETEALQTGKANVSATTQANRHKKMQEVSSLLKFFIRCANKRGPRLKCTDLLAHLVGVLRSSFSCSAYGEDYSSILLKDILSVRKYWCEVTQHQWAELLEVYCGFYNSSSSAINRVLVSRIIHTLVRGCCLQTEGLVHKLFKFFSRALLNARREKYLAVLEHLLAALNIFLRASAVNCRTRVCGLGEELLPSVLCVWAQRRPQDLLKEEIVRFFHLQLRVHHPKGAKTQATGAHAEDWTKWQSLLYSLYDALVSEIGQIGSRGKYSTGSRHVAVKENLIELTADVCQQLFTHDTQVLEVTQSHLDVTQLEGGAPSKRRRIELGWEIVRERLQPSHSDFNVIPWLQITEVLLSKYPSILPGRELVPLLSALCQLLQQQRRGERSLYVMRCLRAAAACRALRPGPELRKLWSRLWALALQGVSSPQAEALSLGLLHAIVRAALAPADKELWRVFSGSACKPSPAAARCLAQVLLQCIVPERLDAGLHCAAADEGSGPPSPREAIARWLLLYELSEEGEESSKPHLVVCRDFPHQLVPRILVALMLKDSRSGMDFLQAPLSWDSLPQEQSVSDEEDALVEIESLYLQSTFDEMPNHVISGAQSCSKDSARGPHTVLQPVRERVERDLMSVADHLLDCYSPDSLTTPPECLIRCMSLLTGVLGGYVHIQFLSEEEVCQTALFQKAQSLAQQVSEFFSTERNKIPDDRVFATIRSVVEQLMTCLRRQEKDSLSLLSWRLFLRILPSRLLNELAEVYKLLLMSPGQRGGVACEAEHVAGEPGGPAEIDLFDDASEAQTSCGTDSGAGSNSSDTQYGTGAKSALAEEHLTKQDLASQAALQLLCLCASSEAVPGLSFRPADVRRKLLLHLEAMDFAKPLHLSTYLTLLRELPAEDTSLSAEDFSSLLRPLRDLCSLYRRDQEVCTAILLSLLPTIRSLSRAGTQVDEQAGAQSAVLRVVSGFCFLGKAGRCTASVRAAVVKCLVALLEADPRCQWAVLSMEEEELSVAAALPLYLADAHHHVRMLAAMSLDRLFQETERHSHGKRRMLPLKIQQSAFENVYLKAQEGIKIQRDCASEEVQDGKLNHKATLLKTISVVMCCSPVCEKQALFALFQSHKENAVEAQLIKKVLEAVSKKVSCRSTESFVSSHLHYLIVEWLGQERTEYSLPAFPYVLLNCSSLQDFYSSCYHVLVPHLVFLDEFDQVKAIGRQIEKDWKELLADCFPKIMVNILPFFALPGQDAHTAQQREKASRVYELLKGSDCLGKQRIDSLIHSNLSEIVVELLMTLYENGNEEAGERGELSRFIGELDPAPNPPYFSSYVIKATLDYLSRCHSSTNKTLVAILSKNPISIQKILLAICKKASDTSNAYEKHRILLMYWLFVKMLLQEVKDGLGGAWAFVLRDVIYTLIHFLGRRPAQLDEVTARSFSLCCDLLGAVCQTAVQFCGDALESHLQVIVGTLTTLVASQPTVSQQQVLNLLEFLVVTNQDNEHLQRAIPLLEPFPDRPAFRELRAVQQQLKYSRGAFTLREEIDHFLSVSPCDSLPLTRLEGLKDLTRQFQRRKEQLAALLKECQDNPANSVLAKLVMSLLQLCKLAMSHSGGNHVLEAAGACLGELGPVNFSTISLLHKDTLRCRAQELFPDKELQWIFIIFNTANSALTDQRIEVRSAAALCLKNMLATQSGARFWEQHRNSNDPLLVYLHPFRPPKKKFLEVERRAGSGEELDSAELWVPGRGHHDDWLRTLCTALLDSGGVRSEVLLLTGPLCQVKTDFCQLVLPLFIHDILLHDSDGSWRGLLSGHVQAFFASFSAAAVSSRSTTPAPSDSEPESPSPGLVDKLSLRTMLAVIDYLRRQKRPIEREGGPAYGTVRDSNFWLELDYVMLAQAAQCCSAPFTALLYAEIYVDKIQLDREESSRAVSGAARRIQFEEPSQSCTIASLSEKSREESGVSLQDLLTDVYRSIGEPDSLYGCGGGRMLHLLTRIRTYEHEALWGKALASYDLHANLPEVTRQVGIIQALQNCGLSSTLLTFLRGLDRESVEASAELQEMSFQAAWRNTQWDCVPSERNDKTGPGFHESVYCTLQALRDKEFSAFSQILKDARESEVGELCRGSLEAVSSLYPALCNLQRISELESVGQVLASLGTAQELGEVFRNWERHSQLLADSDFSFQEPIMALRTAVHKTLLEQEKENEQKEILHSALTSQLLELSKLARASGNTQLAERAMVRIKQDSSARAGMAMWQLEEAQVFWAKREQSLALGILRQLIKTLGDEVDFNPSLAPMYADCLRLSGNWLAESCLESPGVILENYLERAVEVIEDHMGGTNALLQSGKMQAFLSLARFSDAQYQSIDNYMKSSEFENKQALLEKAKQEVDLMREHKVANNRYTVKVQRELKLDEKALSNLQADCRRFLCKAVQNYVKCLELGEEHDLWVFRLCSLWLENCDVKEVCDMMKEGVKKIPSYKFLPLMYQLAARMGTKKPGGAAGATGFHDVLTELISRVCLDHPHHTVFIILALVNADKDESFSQPETSKSKRISKSTPRQTSQLDKERSAVALKVIDVVRKRRARMIKGIETLCDAYISLAYMDASRYKNEKSIQIPADQPITRIKDLEDVVIPTVEMKVDPSGRYEDLVTIRSFRPRFHLAGGVNLPKIVDCEGSDGRDRRQLVKGQDDLRQDAVMQQVFHMCNVLLQRNSETRKRKLTVRRYKVVPFSQRSGVLEWCSGTMPLGDFLVDASKGAHKRFRPNDWSSMACRRKMNEALKSGFEGRLRVFLEVCQNFRPVFRYFCMERFLDPAVWLERRLAYTRSVATSSIVGYIVGLGDRHIQNILIDEQTAELVHIDLGVAFEQGKILPTPETVPFRLTRDIVDGMGITGVEGVFRRCCEKTMEVMRSSHEALLTIVEVLLYDPLFDWTMSPLKAFYLQQQLEEQTELNATLNSTLGGEELESHRRSSDTQSFNKVAERVLLRLQEKLKGVEEGAVLSVDGQVNLLIQQAMDPKNLSRLFPGWQAWV
ncbi:serine-protein kinase ATM isoform X1 [Lepisosteus oculatus]|uniref:serine-protein kinase ATM isoform X1 n=2 Tax=Lepisosteus oculatus TaxID=7918 RepID=UPI00372265FD